MNYEKKIVKGKVKGKVGPTRMKKSDVTFDYLASSQLREEAPKNLKVLRN